jgi:hypothetical protein
MDQAETEYGVLFAQNTRNRIWGFVVGPWPLGREIHTRVVGLFYMV